MLSTALAVFVVMYCFFGLIPMFHFLTGFFRPLNGCRIWLKVYNDPQGQKMEAFSNRIASNLKHRGGMVFEARKHESVPAIFCNVEVDVILTCHEPTEFVGKVVFTDCFRLDRHLEIPFSITSIVPTENLEKELAESITKVLQRAWGKRNFFIYSWPINFQHPLLRGTVIG